VIFGASVAGGAGMLGCFGIASTKLVTMTRRSLVSAITSRTTGIN
jgi:hypothetical protein